VKHELSECKLNSFNIYAIASLASLGNNPSLQVYKFGKNKLINIGLTCQTCKICDQHFNICQISKVTSKSKVDFWQTCVVLESAIICNLALAFQTLQMFEQIW
jgi:hypothetical protein